MISKDDEIRDDSKINMFFVRWIVCKRRKNSFKMAARTYLDNTFSMADFSAPAYECKFHP